LSAEEIARNTFSVLPLLAVLIPTVAAVAVVAIGERNEKLRNLVALLAALAALGVVLAIAMHVMRGALLYFDLAIMQVGHGISVALAVDPLAACFSVIAAILWVAAMAHSSAYMGHEHKRTRFFAAMMVTEAAILGMFMVQDFLSLFVFFEIMGLAAYFLVVHTETDKAQRAATKYLFMTIIGGLSLLMGIFLYLGHAGTVGFVPPPQSGFLTGPLRVAPLVCMVAGFGVKAGIVPLHVWLPDAHPVAPSPASALLSGIMIKAGAYGIIRTVTSYFHVPPPDIQSLGLALIGIAIVTAFIGMVLAVRQSDLKTTLAYSSISQMGFLLLGVGCLAFLREEGAIGLGAGLYHITSHAFFKACLFLVAGSVLYCTHEASMFSLGGLWRKMPVTTVIWCIAVLGLMGIPLFNGFVSKSMLHHAIVEAQYMAAGGSYAAWLQAVEVLYTVIAAGTILYGLKMSYYVFFRRPSQEASDRLRKVREAPNWMLVGAGVLAAGVLAGGLAPAFVLRNLIIPAVAMFGGLDSYGVAHLGDLHIYSWYHIKDILLPLALGAGLFIALTLRARSKNREATCDPFCFGLPSWLSVDRWYVQGARGLVQACFGSEAAFSRAREAFLGTVGTGSVRLSRSVRGALTPLTGRYANDIALGALFIAVFLALFLILTLV